MTDTQLEVCLCAALKTADGYVIRGHRHDDCIQTAIKMKKQIDRQADHTGQGFLTSRGRFVTRREAMKIQIAAGIQSVAFEGGYRGDILFSEDLY